MTGCRCLCCGLLFSEPEHVELERYIDGKYERCQAVECPWCGSDELAFEEVEDDA